MGKKPISKMIIKLPKPLKEAIKDGYVISIIHFGSSLCENDYYNDIDLAVVVRSKYYENFIEKVYGENFDNFDISLIREGEVQGPERFRFGGHGAHFLKSLIEGKVIYGINPFNKFRVTKLQIRNSVTSRLYDYIEDVRRTIFLGKIKRSVEKRWLKFLKLSIFLIDSDLKYSQVLRLNEEQLKIYLKKHQINVGTRPNNLLIAYERVWNKVLNKCKLIPSVKSKIKKTSL